MDKLSMRPKNIAMIKNHLKVAIRNILRQKGTSMLNISGLAIGIACSILITLFVRYELSYDRFHENAEQIYRIAVRASIGDTKINQTNSSAITFIKLMEDFPETEIGVKFLNIGRTPISLGDKTFYEPKVIGVDSTFFDVFTFPLIFGDKETVLGQPNTLVLSEEMAQKYFRRTDVVGETLSFDFTSFGEGRVEYKIVGVAENFPANSHFHADFLLSMLSFPDLINNTGWSSNNFKSYLMMKQGTVKEVFDEKLKTFTRKYMGEERYDEWVAQGNYWEYYLQPLADIHLNSDLNGEFEANGNKTYVYIFSIISVIILLIACINFMNLSTAKSSLRAKEVGMRKVVGASRRSLIFQFLSESIIISYISLIIGLLLVQAFLPVYRTLVDRPIEIQYFNDVEILPTLLIGGLIIGIISGSYPAFFLSSFKPTRILKSNTGDAKSGSWVRNGLVIFQFSISIFLIIGTLTVYNQLKYLQNKKLGFNKEQILIINNPGTLSGSHIAAFKETLLSQAAVSLVSGSNFLPGQGFSNIGFGAEDVEESFTLNIGVVDHNYAETLELEIVDGRFFDKAFKSDSVGAILNEKAAEILGWENPLGKKINNWSEERGNFTVVGVVKDFHYESLHQEVRPMALFLSGGYYTRTERNIIIRLNTADIPTAISNIENVWQKQAPAMPFEYSFLDDDYNQLYINEQQTSEIFTIFSVLAIFIASLGLFGLASFITDQKTKEIGLRKVLGASVGGLIQMLNASFVKWVMVASIIAWPLAWFIMNGWLQNFAYRINQAWWVFVVAAVLALVISILVVSLQTVKAALRNPIDSLKYE
jgi:putative ABC transport system permease protein